MDKLVSPDGKREWTPESPAQRVNLLAQGWTVAKKTRQSTPKTDK